MVLFAVKVLDVSCLHAPLSETFAAPTTLLEQQVSVPSHPCSLWLQALLPETLGVKKNRSSHHSEAMQIKINYLEISQAAHISGKKAHDTASNSSLILLQLQQNYSPGNRGCMRHAVKFCLARHPKFSCLGLTTGSTSVLRYLAKSLHFLVLQIFSQETWSIPFKRRLQ